MEILETIIERKLLVKIFSLQFKRFFGWPKLKARAMVIPDFVGKGELGRSIFGSIFVRFSFFLSFCIYIYLVKKSRSHTMLAYTAEYENASPA